MNRKAARAVAERWLPRARAAIDEIDRDLRGRPPEMIEGDQKRHGQRGSNRTFPLTLLFQAKVYMRKAYGNDYIQRFVEDDLQEATADELALFRLAERPSKRQLYHLDDRLNQWIGDDEARRQKVCDLLVFPSVPDAQPPRNSRDEHIRSVDTTLFDAWCSTAGVNTETAKAEGASDPDARWRAITREGGTDSVLGYAAINQCRQHGPREYIERCYVVRANEDDWTPAARMMVEDVRNGRWANPRAVVDRGFSAHPSFRKAMRDEGIRMTFDLKKNQVGVTGNVNGNPIINGWLYAANVPTDKIRPQPGVKDKAGRRKWRKDMAELDRYKFLPNGRQGPGGTVRAQSPSYRNTMWCADDEGSWDGPADRPFCPGGHEPGKGCLARNVTVTPDMAEDTLQYPPYGSPEWHDIYAQRGGVERAQGNVKSNTGPNFVKGSTRTRGINKAAMAWAAAVAAWNLHLSELDEKQAAALRAKKQRERDRRAALVPDP